MTAGLAPGAVGRGPSGRAALEPIGSWSSTAAAAAVALGLAITSITLGWRGGDLPAHLFRVGLVQRSGFEVWNNFWFAGHFTPGYSVLFPAVAASLGVWTVAIASSVAGAVAFDRLLVGVASPRRWVASLWFASSTVTNVAVGRLPFALGLALALGALALAQRGHRRWAGLAALATPLASPVAGAFLALAFVAWAAVAPRERRAVLLGAAALAMTPVLVFAVLYPQGGMFPFRWSALVWVLAVCGAVIGLVPSRWRAVRVGAALYAVASIAAFVIPTPLGANITRLGMYLAGPILVALVPARRLVLSVLAVPIVWWQWSPALDAVLRSGRDESTTAEFYEPLVQYLGAHGGVGQRVEVVPTRRHWEAAYVALEVPIARGWERQLDLRHHALFYGDELTEEQYLDWLVANGVELVAMADAPLDVGGELEAALLEEGVPGLDLVWRTDDWRVWRLDSAVGLVDGPARVVELGVDSVTLDIEAAGDVVLRVRYDDAWTSIEVPVCIRQTPEGWMVLDDVTAGRLTLFLDGGRSIPLFDDDPCAADPERGAKASVLRS